MTIKRGASVVEQADQGNSFVQGAPSSLVSLAMSQDYPADQFFLADDEEWSPPVGAFKRCGGPS